MKKIRRFFLLLLCVLLLGAQLQPVNASVEESCVTLDAGRSLAGSTQLLPTAKAAVLYFPETDTMVYSWQPDERLDPSGMNKIMTALLALENGNLDAVVTVTANALNTVEPGAMSAGLKAGEQMTLRDLLYCMMVGSANDAAAVIAEHISGNQGAFVTLMNLRAKELGCQNTCFMNPSGLSQEGQYTTARDLAKITAYALKLDDFVTLFSAAEYTVPATDHSEARIIHTTNYMMSDASVKDQLDKRVTGGKTGALTTRDRSLICTAEKDGLRFLSVVMSAQSKLTSTGLSVSKFGNFEETGVLLDHAFSKYGVRQLLTAGLVMDRFRVAGGENDLAVTSASTVSALMPKEMSSEQLEYRCVGLDGVAVPVERGAVVGSVQLWYDSICVAQGDLIAMHPVQEEGASYLFLEPQADPSARVWKEALFVIVWVILGIVVLIVAALVVLRAVNIFKSKRRKAKRSASVRRR